MAHLNLPPPGTLRIEIVWLIALIAVSWHLGSAVSWYLGSLGDDGDGGLMGWLAIVLVFVPTAALGTALSVQRANWLWLIAAASVGSIVATVAWSVAVFSVPNDLGAFHPQLLFIEFLVDLLVPLAIGTVVGVSWRVLRRVRSR